jgi:hypothetical protein
MPIMGGRRRRPAVTSRRFWNVILEIQVVWIGPGWRPAFGRDAIRVEPIIVDSSDPEALGR